MWPSVEESGEKRHWREVEQAAWRVTCTTYSQIHQEIARLLALQQGRGGLRDVCEEHLVRVGIFDNVLEKSVPFPTASDVDLLLLEANVPPPPHRIPVLLA